MKIYLYDQKYRMLTGYRETEELNPVLLPGETLEVPNLLPDHSYNFFTRSEGSNWLFRWHVKPGLCYEQYDTIGYEIEHFGYMVPDNCDTGDLETVRRKVKQDIHFQYEIERKERNYPVYSETLNTEIHSRESEITGHKGIDRLLYNAGRIVPPSELLKLYRYRIPVQDYTEHPVDWEATEHFRTYHGKYIHVTRADLLKVREELINEYDKMKKYKAHLYLIADKTDSIEELLKIKWHWPEK